MPASTASVRKKLIPIPSPSQLRPPMRGAPERFRHRLLPANSMIRAQSRESSSLALVAVMLACLATASIAQAPPTSPDSVSVPLTEQANWQVLQYSRLPPHRIRFSGTGLEIRVDGSAMPLIHPLPRAVPVKSFRVKGRIEGTLRVPAERQGEENFDDYAFRLGLVEPGERSLNFLQRQFAAAWVRKLFELAPKGGGISRIHFFNVGTHENQIGRQRQHPLSDLILETVVAVPGPDGRFDLVHTLERPLETIALWLSSDGDDTGSKFTVLVEQIELRSAP
jgi:hypothetical protein